MLGIYRSQSNDVDNLINDLNSYIDKYNNKSNYYIIAGDINIDICYTDKSFNYLNTMASHNF